MVLISCKNCHKMYEKENYDDFVCIRCKHKVRHRIQNSLQVSLALTICAILLYIPAMLYPMMEVTKLGVNVESTILEDVIRACLKNHFCNLHAPICGIFCLHSVEVARYAALI